MHVSQAAPDVTRDSSITVGGTRTEAIAALSNDPRGIPDSGISDLFHTLVLQPTTLCNLDCSYCYLPDRKRQALMPVTVARACAASIWNQASSYPVDVVWHGGEPTTTPIPHLHSLLSAFEDLRSKGRIRYGIQSNGTLIDNRWCDLFSEYDFEVGISVDGPPWANRDRVDRRGGSTFSRTRRGIERLQAAGIDFTVICVVTPSTIGHADELVDFFSAIGCGSVGFNIEEEEGAGRPGVEERQAYEFWRTLLRRRAEGNNLRVRELDRLNDYIAAERVAGITRKPFDPIPTVAHNGDTVLLSPELLGIKDDGYSDFLAGNVLHTSLSKMIADAHRLKYVIEFERALRACAADCEFFSFCGGAQAGNRYFEHGSFASAETAYCRNTRQSLIRAAADHLTDRTTA
jgi:uncharacterized protein